MVVIHDPELLAAVEGFLAERGMSSTAFGTLAMNDPTLVHELRRGRDCKASTRARIMAFIVSARTLAPEAAA